MICEICEVDHTVTYRQLYMQPPDLFTRYSSVCADCIRALWPWSIDIRPRLWALNDPVARPRCTCVIAADCPTHSQRAM